MFVQCGEVIPLPALKLWHNKKNWAFTSFPSSALPCDENALVLVLVPQRAVGLVCQSVAAKAQTRKPPRYICTQLTAVHVYSLTFCGWGQLEVVHTHAARLCARLHGVYTNHQHVGSLAWIRTSWTCTDVQWAAALFGWPVLGIWLWQNLIIKMMSQRLWFVVYLYTYWNLYI